jgi:uncharacterized iron-regulated protein
MLHRRIVKTPWIPGTAASTALLFSAVLASGCAIATDDVGARQAGNKTAPSAAWIDLASLQPMEKLAQKLADRRVVLVGETHTRYDHHQQQLAILKALHARHPKMALGVEWFQQPAQPHLDDYLAGRISEAEMIERTGYFDRWRFDYRLYRPVIQYAKENGIPVIALNAPAETTNRISEVGVDGLSPEERTRLPDIDRSNTEYENHLKRFFDQHPGERRNFDRFVDVQLTWDESMAQRAAEYLKQNPDRHMVIMAGSGHLAYRWGIPDRLKRRMPGLSTATVLFDDGAPANPRIGDYLVFSPELALPSAGLLGLLLDTTPEGVKVKGVSEESAAGAAGIKEGDRLVAIDEQPITSYAALRMAMLERRPGETVNVRYERKPLFGGPTEKTIGVVLR